MFFFFITLISLLDRRLIGDWSAISRGPVPDRSATSCIKSQRGLHEVADQSPISRRPVPDQSPTSRRPTAKPCCDSSATSAIVMNFGRGEVAERLQCMSDLGFLCKHKNLAATDLVATRSPISRRLLCNLVGTDWGPCCDLCDWCKLSVAERSQSGCNVCLTGV